MTDDDIGVSVLREWRENPCKFVWDNFHVQPDKWQEDALNAFADPDKARISLQACAGPGKTTVLAWCGWNFLTCYGTPFDHPKGAAVATTAANLKDNLWPEFSAWQGRSETLKHQFVWTKERISSRDYPETWFLSARSWSKKANAEEQGRTLSGLHSRYVLVLVDESGDIPISVLNAAEQALSTGPVFGKIIQAGNPSSLEGMLYAAANRFRHKWHVIRITADPDDPNRSPRVSREWAEQALKDNGGRADPNHWAKVYILGMFPPSSLNALLGIEDVEAAMSRHLHADAYDFAQKRLGIDIARFGDDRSVIFPRQGLAAFKPVIMRNYKTQDLVARIMKAKATFGSELELIDDTGGWAAGVIDGLDLAGVSVIPVNFSGKATDPRYFNIRSQMHFEAAEWVKNGGALPDIPELIAEAVAPLYWFEGGKFRVEEKEHIKARIGRSPDLWDAKILTHSMPDMPGRHTLTGMEAILDRAARGGDFDPYREMNEQTKRDFDPYRDTV